jgi:hypothetical protein
LNLHLSNRDPSSIGQAAKRIMGVAITHARRVLGQARYRARAGRDRWACQAVETTVNRQGCPTLNGDELVQNSLLIAPTECRRFTLGTSPRDSRVTMLADLREPGALPPMAFSRIVLVRPFSGPGRRAVTANILDALLPSGELTATMSRKTQRALEAGGLETIEVCRTKLVRVVRMRRGA